MECESASSTTIYNEVVIKIDHFSKITHFILMKVTLAVCAIVPISATYFRYYILDWNDESFPNFSLMYGIKYGILIDQSLQFVKIY